LEDADLDLTRYPANVCCRDIIKPLLKYAPSKRLDSAIVRNSSAEGTTKSTITGAAVVYDFARKSASAFETDKSSSRTTQKASDHFFARIEAIVFSIFLSRATMVV
jgi:CRISPR/Cas system endoribonuclease Cas6 (RAMP superfamily)